MPPVASCKIQGNQPISAVLIVGSSAVAAAAAAAAAAADTATQAHRCSGLFLHCQIAA